MDESFSALLTVARQRGWMLPRRTPTAPGFREEVEGNVDKFRTVSTGFS